MLMSQRSPHPSSALPSITRRRFARWLGLAPAVTLSSVPSIGAARPRVVIVGGGAGGASTARLLARDGGDRLDITLVEPSGTYTTCFQSNLYLGGYRTLGSLQHDYRRLATEHGVRVVQDRVTHIDRDRRLVALANGEADDGTRNSTLGYDRLVVAPGIELLHDSLPGHSAALAEIAPHAWQGAQQLALLKSRLDALGNGDHVIIVAPPNPYRCPPGPYERASMIARLFQRRGLTDSRITLLDTKTAYSKQALFEASWRRHYPGTIEWLPPDVHGGILSIDATRGMVETDLDTFQGQLLNLIPAQRAGAIAQDAALADASGFCPIDPGTMRSTLDPAISVLGDACIAGDMPKSAFAANSQARVVAANLLGELLDRPVPTARYGNICWSQIADDDSIKVGGGYASSGNRIASSSAFISERTDDASTREANVGEAQAWYRSITTEMFGGTS